MNFIRKSYWLIGGFAILLIVVMSYVYYFSFPVEKDLSNLEGYIKDYYNRGYSLQSSPDIKIHDSVTIGKIKYVLIEIDEYLGSVVLSQSITGRYKINRLSYGGGNFREQIIESEGEKYLLYGGRNTNLELARMVFTLDGITYTLDIPERTRFLVYMKVDSRTEKTHLDLDKIKLYNSEGIDITEKVDLSGAGI